MSTARFVRLLAEKFWCDRLVPLAALLAMATASAGADDDSSIDLYGDQIPAHAAVRLGSARYRGSGGRVPPLFIAGDEALVTMSGQRQLVLIEAATGKRVREINLGEQNLIGVCLSPDRRSLFTFGHEFNETQAQNFQTVTHWDLTAGKLLETMQFTERTGSENFAITPDGSKIVTGSGDGTLRFRDMTTGDEVLNYKIDKSRIDALAMSPDGKLIAVSASNNVYLWEWTTGNNAEKIPVGLRVQSLAFSPDGLILAEGPDSRTEIVLRDVKSRKVLRTLEDTARNPMYVTSLDFTTDGRSLVTANTIGLRGREVEFRVHAWDVATGTILQQFAMGAARPSRVAVSGDGRWIAASTDATVKVWDLGTGRLMGGEMPAHDSDIQSIQLSRDGRIGVTAGQDGTIRTWDAMTGTQLHVFRHAYWVRGCALSGDDRLIASSSLDDTVRLWDVSTEKEIYRLPGHGDLGGTRAIGFSADQSRFVSWGDDFYLRVWDVKTGKALSEWRVHPPEMNLPKGEDDGDRSGGIDFRMHVDQAVFSADARLLVLVHGQSISIFDVATGVLQSKLQNPDGHMISIAFSADGTHVATSSWGRPIQTKLADGRVRSSASKNNMARVLKIVSGEELYRVELPNEGAGPVAFSNDGKLFAVASQASNTPLLVLDAKSGDELTAIEGMPFGARALCFSADGKRLACGFRDGTALVWNLKIPEHRK